MSDENVPENTPLEIMDEVIVEGLDRLIENLVEGRSYYLALPLGDRYSALVITYLGEREFATPSAEELH